MRRPTAVQRMRRANPWVSLAFDSWSLGVAASTVVGLRAARLAAGGVEAVAEAEQMVGEKIAAAIEWQALALTGGLGPSFHSAAAKSLRHYGARVRANRRRLTRARP